MVLIIKGTLVSGKGLGRRFIKLSWVKTQIREKFGFTPFEGTFNVKLNALDSNVFWSFVESHEGILIRSKPARKSGKCFRVKIMDIEGALILPFINHYPRNQIEIIAHINLRDALGLENGASVEVKIIHT